jgi:hypothetical protein
MAWDLHFWRTKEKEEIDLIVETDKVMTLVQIKLLPIGSLIAQEHEKRNS